jgi:hypothetical protein
VLEQEADWVGRQLAAVPAADLSPVLSVGSGTAASRARQPWIDGAVFAPLAERGVRVVHHEHRPAPGVDVAGDLGDAAVLERLAALGARTILCLNVLEHLADPRPVATALAGAVPAGGRLVVTVPRRYPYHPDPIDTMLRPTVDELVAMFPTLELVAGAEVRCGSLLSYAVGVRGKRQIAVNGIRSVVRRGGEGRSADRAKGPGLRGLAPYVLGSTAVTCAVLAATS